MSLNIALAGNPNSGKTTLFNALTGSNQFVGNWPGVTVEHKHGTLKKFPDVTITDLPGIYSLSPYTMEEVIAREFLLAERKDTTRPDAILNIIDGTNLERNLYLTTQLTELGIPVVVAVNMMDIVKKNGDQINTAELSRELGCPVYEISALKGTGVMAAAEAAVNAAKNEKTVPQHTFAGPVEHAIGHIEETVLQDQPEERRRWYAIKIFERDAKALAQLNLSEEDKAHIEVEIKNAEQEMDDDSESIITNERYVYIASIIKGVLKQANRGSLTTSDKIDKIVTNRWLALPIFAIVMFLVYYVSVTTVGTYATDWANDGFFGDGWHLFAIGSADFEEVDEEYGGAMEIAMGFADSFEDEDLADALDEESDEYDPEVAEEALIAFAATLSESDTATYLVEDEEDLSTEEVTSTYEELQEAMEILAAYEYEAPDPADYGIWVPGVPVIIESALEAIDCNEVLTALILDGIVAGVGAVLGFVPQMLVLFIFLAFLESCGYMARIAFILDRVFRKFGLSGKSFIPILIGTGCGVPGIMASRTIENERDRRMTVMTTTFIPCGAKVPFIAMVAGAIFGGAPWVAPSAYFLGIAAIICSGIILKKTKLFIGDPAPFVMELPAYHMPTVGTVLRSMWERGWSFIKKAGTIITLSTILIWFLSFFGFVDGAFTMIAEDELDMSILAVIGSAVSWIFTPLGFGNWQATVASVTGLIAKENIVGTMGILYGAGEGTVYQTMSVSFTAISGYSFLAFNLLCAPCFAAMGAIKREMNSRKWFWVAVGYQCGFAYLVGLVIYNLGMIASGVITVGTVVAVIVAIVFLYMLFRPATRVIDGKKVRVKL